MHCNKYNILMDGEVIASNMELDIAIVLMKALCNEYYTDDSLRITIAVIPPSN